MNITDFYKRYGKYTTTNFQLRDYAKELKIPNFHICMRDEISDLPRTAIPLNVITNIHTSHERGVHWSAFHVSKEKAYFFDSYALPPTKEIIDFLPKNLDRTRNTFQLQDFNDSYCGQLSLYVLYKLSCNEDFQKIILSIVKNE